MSVVNRFNVNNTPVILNADIIENMSANDVSYDSSIQYDENTVGCKLSKLESEMDTKISEIDYERVTDNTNYLYIWRDNFNRPILAITEDFKLCVFNEDGNIVFTSTNAVLKDELSTFMQNVETKISEIDYERVTDNTNYLYIWRDNFNRPILAITEDFKFLKFNNEMVTSILGDYQQSIWMPNKIYMLNGTTIQMFKSSMALLVNPTANTLDIIKESNSAKGINRDTYYEYTVNGSNANFKLKFGLYGDNIGYRYAENYTEFVHVPKAQSPQTNVNILMIGDSFTEDGFYPCELRRLLTGENVTFYCDQSGNFEPDTLTNVTFIGTQGRNYLDNACPCEGYAGMHYGFFATNDFQTHQTSPRQNPFWNSLENKVDFDYYCNKHNYSQIDIAIILLGTNGSNNKEYIKTVWDALIDHNSNIKIIAAGRCFACPYGPGYIGGLDNNRTFINLSDNVIYVNSLLQSLSESNDYSSNVTYVEYRVQLDNLVNMNWTEESANLRRQDIKIKITNDNVHPNKYGYWQIADAIRPAVHKVLNEINN